MDVVVGVDIGADADADAGEGVGVGVGVSMGQGVGCRVQARAFVSIRVRIRIRVVTCVRTAKHARHHLEHAVRLVSKARRRDLSSRPRNRRVVVDLRARIPEWSMKSDE